MVIHNIYNQASVDLTNQKKIETNAKINEENAKAAALQRELNLEYQGQRREEDLNAQLKATKDTIKFWEEKRERDEASARQETIWLAEYWLAYAKQKDKMAQDSRPSNLKFGLL